MQANWQLIMDKLGFVHNLDEYKVLLDLYTDKTRHYHNLDHIADCLDKLALYCGSTEADSVSARELNAIELALWFHDAVYRPLRHDNEERSAEMAVRFLGVNQAPSSLIHAVEKLILATKSHTNNHRDIDLQIMLDIDLSILGADAATFAKYEAGIRKEYHWVPALLYQKKRRSVLQSFLDMPRIYRSTLFHNLFEKAARANLMASLS